MPYSSSSSSRSPPPPTTVSALSGLDRNTFIAALDGVFEHSPWVAKTAYEARPFIGLQALHSALVASIHAASFEDRLALIRTHPMLTGQHTDRSSLSLDSAAEQAGAGLDHCTAAEVTELHTLNQRYQQRFGFPFIIAVKHKSRDQILAALRLRVTNNQAEEFATCLDQIAAIAWLRLVDRLVDRLPDRPDPSAGSGLLDPQPPDDSN